MVKNIGPKIEPFDVPDVIMQASFTYCKLQDIVSVFANKNMYHTKRATAKAKCKQLCNQ